MSFFRTRGGHACSPWKLGDAALHESAQKKKIRQKKNFRGALPERKKFSGKIFENQRFLANSVCDMPTERAPFKRTRGGMGGFGEKRAYVRRPSRSESGVPFSGPPDADYTPVRRKWGRKPPVGEQPWPDQPRTPTPAEVCAWLERWLPSWFKVLGWHRELIEMLYGEPRPYEAFASIPRGNGKTTIAAGISVFELLGRGEPNAQVLHLATSQRQARLCYNAAVTMIEQRPELASRCGVSFVGGYEQLNVLATGGFMLALPTRRSMKGLQGYTPSLAVIDEVGFIEEESWVSMAQAVVKRESAQILGIGTPGFDESGLMYRMRSMAAERPSEHMRFLEWAAPGGCELEDREAWRAANPALGEVKFERGMAALLHSSTEADFRTFQLGQWVGRAGSWLPAGLWSSLERMEAPPEGTEVTLGFDGSASGDATAICWSAEDVVGVVDMWERPGLERWRVPRTAVMETIRWAFEHWKVRSLYADPWGWRSELEQLEREFGTERVVQFAPTWAKMAPAVDRFQQAVMDGRLAHDHHPGLARHVGNATVRRSARGLLIEKADSEHHIDAAVAAILAYHASETAPPAPVYSERAVY